ncbi:MAG: 3-hydroxybutyrate oligomer hydrolase family protein, partial [Stenotrophomonas koreensis]
MPKLRAACALSLGLVLAGCASTDSKPTVTAPASLAVLHETVHRQNDDLLSAGLGHAGLLTAAPPAFADPAAPTAAEVRRRALWNSWRGIADLMPGGGFGQLYGTLQPVPGREYATLVRLPDARQPHRVVVQVPDNFDAAKRCVVVAPSSGSRGVYGAVAVAGPWALPRGCALAYTDKGAGSDYFDLDAQVGVRADGSTAALQAADDFAFLPDAPVNASGVAVKHAHSQDNPESDWGRHVRQAADIALQALNQALPEAPAFTHANTRVIAVGISNGGGAVLRAAEQGQGWLDGVVAGEPNIYSNGAGSRALYDYTTEAAELMPCALLAVDGLPGSPLSAAGRAGGAVRCATLATQGAITGTDTAAQAADALRKMAAAGWTLPA